MDVNLNASKGESQREARGRATRAALVAAARGEFGSRGYADTSVDDIVARAGVTKGAFYHHFDTKKQLFVEVFTEVEREVSRAAFVVHLDHQPFQPPEDLSPQERSRAIRRFVDQSDADVWRLLQDRCRRYLEFHTDPQVKQIALVDARWVLPWTEWQSIKEEQGVVLLRADLRRTSHRGLLKPLPLPTLALLLKGALNEACMVVAAAEDQNAALEEAMVVIEAFLEGLRADDQGSRRSG